MSSIGMCALFASITPSPTYNRSISANPAVYSFNPRQAIRRYVFGLHDKTKRSLAEEAESGDEVSVASWIREGVDPNECDAYGYSPLLNAAAMGRLGAVKELIKNGADVNKCGPYGYTPLHAAAQNGYREVVSLLLKNGANINAQNEEHNTSLHLALRAIRIEIVYMLVRNGGDVRIKGFMGKDCIQVARECGLIDMAQTLSRRSDASIGYHPYSAPEIRST
jgi:ankyrin repeat protein